MALEKIALETITSCSANCIERRFLLGIVQRALGIPVSLFTAIFALARTVGWIAQWNENLGSRAEIGRPRQLYTGAKRRDVSPSRSAEGLLGQERHEQTLISKNFAARPALRSNAPFIEHNTNLLANPVR